MDRTSFWDRSWRAVDPERLAAAEALAQREDPLLRLLRRRGAVSVCDAGCGCGAFALRLAACGFRVSGFDIAEDAAALTRRLLTERGYDGVDFRAADIRSTGWADDSFDAAVARSVLDHLPLRDGLAAVQELLRIVRPGGCVLLTLDAADEEYETEPHEINRDGDWLYTAGKWRGMVFHPWSRAELDRLASDCGAEILPSHGGGYVVVLEKGAAPAAGPETLKLRDLRPSQFYISEKKLRDVEAWFNPGDLSSFEPIPVKLLDGEPVMTDGHTRAVAALRAGLDAVPLVWDEDELDWDMYRACVAACRERGVLSPSDLPARIIPEAEYGEKWDRWCDALHEKLERKRIPAERPLREEDSCC